MSCAGPLSRQIEEQDFRFGGPFQRQGRLIDDARAIASVEDVAVEVTGSLHHLHIGPPPFHRAGGTAALLETDRIEEGILMGRERPVAAVR